MGYCFDSACYDNKFFIEKENIEKAKNVLENYYKENKPKWRWVNDSDFIETETLSIPRWEFLYTENNITNIEFVGEKIGNDFDIFKIIAQFVKNNSYIECHGEDGYLWRWVFKNGKCKEINPKIVWENDNEKI